MATNKRGNEMKDRNDKTDRHGVEYPPEMLAGGYEPWELRDMGIAVGDPIIDVRAQTPEETAAAEGISVEEVLAWKRYARAKRLLRERLAREED